MTSSSTTSEAAAVSAAGTAAVVDGDVVVQGSCVMGDKLSCGIALHDDQQLKSTSARTTSRSPTITVIYKKKLQTIYLMLYKR